MQRALFYIKHIDKFTSPKHNFLVFSCKHQHSSGLSLLGSRCHNFRHLQHSCSSRAAVLLTCLEDIAQDHPFYCSSCIPDLFLLFQKLFPQNRLHLAPQKICRLVVGKEASTFSTLHGIANCIKKRTTRKIVSSDRCQRLASVLPTTTFDQV